MKKTDVQQRYDRGTYRPTINVKWQPWIFDLIAKYEGTGAHEFSSDAEFWAWVNESREADYSSEWAETADEFASEQGWEDAKELAAEIFPQSVEVWSDGRSGGWLVVDGLPDVEDWDAIQLAKWAKFARGVQAILDDLDYQFVWHLNVNVWEPHNERAKKLAEVMVRA